MNQLAQVLKKRVDSLAKENVDIKEYVASLEDTITLLLKDLEYTESVGCAFAFELGGCAAMATKDDDFCLGTKFVAAALAGSWDNATKATP